MVPTLGERKKRKVYAVRRHDGSLCTQKQPETAACRVLKAATRRRKSKSDPKGGQPVVFCVYDQFFVWSSPKNLVTKFDNNQLNRVVLSYVHVISSVGILRYLLACGVCSMWVGHHDSAQVM